MQFMAHFTSSTQHRDAILKRFAEIGAGEPSTIKIVGHWFSVTQLEGWAVVEADDAAELVKVFHTWTDLAVNHITPVVPADTMRAMISS